VKPMLAFRYQDHKEKVNYPCQVQPKLNGIRMLYRAGTCQSRSHALEQPKTWSDQRLLHIRHHLSRVSQRYILDGEIYRHGWSLQKINGAASVNGLLDTHNTVLLEYHVFDVIDTENIDAPFQDRFHLIDNIIQSNDVIKAVPTFWALNEIDGDRRFSTFKQMGFEGMMYRDPLAPYGLVSRCSNKENRWRCLLKRKDWLDEECEIMDFSFGEGKYHGMIGAFLFRFREGRTFWAGSGLSDSERATLVNDPPIGKRAKIKYEMLSDEGVPLKPTIECLYL